jgi:hypothetical protein
LHNFSFCAKNFVPFLQLRCKKIRPTQMSIQNVDSQLIQQRKVNMSNDITPFKLVSKGMNFEFNNIFKNQDIKKAERKKPVKRLTKRKIQKKKKNVDEFIESDEEPIEVLKYNNVNQNLNLPGEPIEDSSSESENEDERPKSLFDQMVQN